MIDLNLVKLRFDWLGNQYSDPPLGLLSVASQARKYGANVFLTDLAHETKIPRADIYAFTASTLEVPSAIQKAREIRGQYTHAKIIVGGPHYDVQTPELLLKDLERGPFDVISKGEGETTIGPILDHLRTNPNRRIVMYQSPTRGPESDLIKYVTKEEWIEYNDTPFPAMDLLDREKYFQTGVTFLGAENEGASSTIIVTRGCPYACTFCASPIINGRTVNYRSLAKVEEEVEILIERYDVKALRWHDDCIPLTFKWIPRLEDFLEDTKILSRGSARTDQIVKGMDPELYKKAGVKPILERMWQAGFREIGFGIESAENEVLKGSEKRNSVEAHREALRLAKSFGFRTRAFMITGLPFETVYSADRTIDFLEETNPDIVTLTSFVPLPGTAIYNHPEKFGRRLLKHDWSNINFALQWGADGNWVDEPIQEMVTGDQVRNNHDRDTNREKLKEYVFSRGKFNVQKFNGVHISPVIEELRKSGEIDPTNKPYLSPELHKRRVEIGFNPFEDVNSQEIKKGALNSRIEVN